MAKRAARVPVAEYESLRSTVAEARLTQPSTRGTVAFTSPLENCVPRPAAQRITAARPPVLPIQLGSVLCHESSPAILLRQCLCVPIPLRRGRCSAALLRRRRLAAHHP